MVDASPAPSDFLSSTPCFDLVCCDHKWKPQSMIHWYCHKWSG